jgi:hypothetical protein
MHAILAGTAGASSLVLFSLLRATPKVAILGMVAAATIIYCSSSTGPIGTLLAGLAMLLLWPARRYIPLFCIITVVALVALHAVMKDPVWYLLARIDVTGGSTGYHRARLITAALDHIDRWWLVGTDYTRDWIPYGIEWSRNHVDITNYYIKMGVIGGLPLMLLFICLFVTAFRALGRGINTLRVANDSKQFVLWCASATLFAHCVTLITVSYFDQSIILFSIILGSVPGLCHTHSHPTAQARKAGRGENVRSGVIVNPIFYMVRSHCAWPVLHNNLRREF